MLTSIHALTHHFPRAIGILFVAWMVGAAPTSGAADLTTIPATQPTSQPATRPAQTPVLADNTVLYSNVPYGGPDATLNVLDIYAPPKFASAPALPVLIFVHGGEWSRGDKLNVSCKPKFFNEHGVLFVSLNYRLAPKDPHPAQVNDVATAIGWVHDHIAAYGGDPAKIVIMGHSAGCHLVTLVTLNPEALARVHLKPSDLRGTVAWSGGMSDLVDRANGPGLYPPFIKATFGTSEKAQRAASPLTYAKNAKEAPAFLIASVDDDKSQSSREASKKLLDALNAAGGNAKAALLEGKTHF
ncbi:MAG: alpha/beta hydrolase, partial [Phycisphaerae bacterium]